MTLREQTTIRLPGELMQRIRREADKRGDSFNETIVRLIRLGFQAESSQSLSHSPRQPAS